MDGLERRFALATVAIAAVRPDRGALGNLNAPYAHTFVLEDSYLSALAAALLSSDFGSLPHTESEQRAAIIEWRTRLEVLAGRLHVTLPDDLQVAGRGEIAPSPTGE